jgi:glycosyltransferase involved in cell wall biosynthesis
LVTTRAWWRALAAPLEVLLSRVTDAIICVSDFELTRARQHGIPASRLARIYNGISATDIATPNPFDSSKFNLLFVGRFDRQKGFDVLLDAWTRAARSDARLTVIGDWVIDRASSPELPAGVQAIEWRTPAQLRAYYQHADAIIVPSRWEGFALVPLEAMRDGLCVVASDACSLPEAVQHGSTGFIFETGDAAALAKVLASITAEDCRRLGLHGQQVFQARFTADRMRRLVRSLYQDLARANRA